MFALLSLLVTAFTHTHLLQGRYAAFLRMVHEWRILKLLKRSARGHYSDGVQSTREGDCAILCPACPQPGKNLPNNWRDAPPDSR